MEGGKAGGERKGGKVERRRVLGRDRWMKEIDGRRVDKLRDESEE